MGKRKSSSPRAKLQAKKTMGKRKRKRRSSRSRAKKKIPMLDAVFGCPFCGYNSSVECTIDKKSNIGMAACSVCHLRYYTNITPLMEAIDIFIEWIDECERVSQEPFSLNCLRKISSELLLNLCKRM